MHLDFDTVRADSLHPLSPPFLPSRHQPSQRISDWRTKGRIQYHFPRLSGLFIPSFEASGDAQRLAMEDKTITGSQMSGSYMAGGQ